MNKETNQEDDQPTQFEGLAKLAAGFIVGTVLAILLASLLVGWVITV